MDDPAPVVPGPARLREPPPSGPPRWGGRWKAWAGAPFRYARRRPFRTAGLLVLVLAAGGVLGAAGAYGWYHFHLSAARSAVERGHNAEAARHLRACQRVRPDDREVNLLIARVARRGGEWEEAERFLDACWAAGGDDEALVRERLYLRAARGDVEAASAPILGRIAAGATDASAAREALVTGHLYRFQWERASRLLDDWLAAEPDNTSALLLSGKLDEQRQANDRAVAAYRRVVELDPDHDEARLRLTTVLLHRFRGEEALEHLRTLRRRLPENAEVAFQWAAALGLQGRAGEARAALDECLQKFPRHPAALAERGRYAALDGDDEAAADYLRRSIGLDPGNLAARHQYAQTLRRLGRTAEAAAAEKAIEDLKADLEEMNRLIAGPMQATPDDPDVPHRIAVIALHAGQPAEAVRWLHRALQVSPEHLPTHQTLTNYYYAVGNPIMAGRHRAIVQRLAGRS